MDVSRSSFSSNAVLEEPFPWVYELEDIGFTGWEMVQEGTQCLSEETLPKVREVLETTNLVLTMHMPFSDMNLAGLNTGIHGEVLRQMKNYLSLASGLVEVAVVHPGYLSPYGKKVPDRAWDTNVRSIQELCDTAEEYGITIAVENMPDFPMIFGREPDEMLRMMDDVDRDNLGMTLDVGHANTAGHLEEFLAKCSDRIIHVHLHDNMGKRDEHLPAGRGSVNWKAVKKGLSGYNGRLVTEMSNLEEGRESLDFLKGL
ncbi:sugar phosphate isomerase/epimerase family protein [Methanococcoides methylutens]|uniref:sugar phosphate isomerase/epimerase family protein n=1 Tax=Methanococcoides methylutens TaxID=2226 RepID=UPI0040442CF8